MGLERWTFAGRHAMDGDDRDLEWLVWYPSPEMVGRGYTPFWIEAGLFWERHRLERWP